MHFCHSSEVWRDFPELAAGALFARGITDSAGGVSSSARVEPRIAGFMAQAESRLAATSEAGLPEVQGWRRAFSKMGLKPTQYRCASEALLRRFRKERALPRIHPVVDLCNAISLAFAIPVAALDVARIADYVEVRYASGTEDYAAFSGETEHPEAHEVIFADGAGRAHARRWTSRQSAYSAVGEETTAILVVAEAMHDSGASDVQKLIATIAAELEALWAVESKSGMLSRSSRRFEF